VADEHGTSDGARSEPRSDLVECGVEGAAAVAIEGQRELGREVVGEVGDSDADEREALPLDQRHRGGEQPSRRDEDGLRVGGCVREGVRPRRPRVVTEAQPEHDRTTDPPRGPQAVGDAVDQRHEDSVDLAGRLRRAAERTLRPDRASAAAPLHRPRIAIVGEGMDVPAGRSAEHGNERRLRKLCDLADRGDPPVPELLRNHRPDAPEPLDGERVEEGQLTARRHHEQPIGLGHAARHLREELRPCHPDRDR